MTALHVIPERESSYGWAHFTGVRVQALDHRGFVREFDVAQLTRESLIAWLYSGLPCGRDIQTLILQALNHERPSEPPS